MSGPQDSADSPVPMLDPAGNPYDAESQAEAKRLELRGYSRVRSAGSGRSTEQTTAQPPSVTAPSPAPRQETVAAPEQ